MRRGGEVRQERLRPAPPAADEDAEVAELTARRSLRVMMPANSPASITGTWFTSSRLMMISTSTPGVAGVTVFSAESGRIASPTRTSGHRRRSTARTSCGVISPSIRPSGPVTMKQRRPVRNSRSANASSVAPPAIVSQSRRIRSAARIPCRCVLIAACA
jgi:hypothetical protein